MKAHYQKWKPVLNSDWLTTELAHNKYTEVQRLWSKYRLISKAWKIKNFTKINKAKLFTPSA